VASLVNTFSQAFLEVLHYSLQHVGRNCYHFFPDVLFQIHRCPWFLFIQLALEISSEEEVLRLGTLVPMTVEVLTKYPLSQDRIVVFEIRLHSKSPVLYRPALYSNPNAMSLARRALKDTNGSTQLFCKIVRYFCRTLCNIRYKCPVWFIVNCSLATNKSCYKFSYFNAVTGQMLVLFWVSAPYIVAMYSSASAMIGRTASNHHI
jgi:hypothetical protein